METAHRAGVLRRDIKLENRADSQGESVFLRRPGYDGFAHQRVLRALHDHLAVVRLFVNGPIRVPFIRWRFNGGHFLGPSA